MWGTMDARRRACKRVPAASYVTGAAVNLDGGLCPVP